jgi:archaellum component FlaC
MKTTISEMKITVEALSSKLNVFGEKVGNLKA